MRVSGNGSVGNGSDGNGSVGNCSDGNGSDGNGSGGNISGRNGSDGNGSDGNGSDGNGSGRNSIRYPTNVPVFFLCRYVCVCGHRSVRVSIQHLPPVCVECFMYVVARKTAI